MKKIFFLYILLPQISLAEEIINKNQESLENALNSNLYTPNYFSMVFGLIIVISLIYLTGFIYQKLVRVKLSDSKNTSEEIEILHSVSLGQGKNLHIIKVDDEKILIGATQDNITCLKTFKKPHKTEACNEEHG